VEFRSTDLHVYAQTSGDLPPVGVLMSRLDDDLPAGFPVVVVTSLGEKIVHVRRVLPRTGLAQVCPKLVGLAAGVRGS
jgi:hypothetical protein